MHHTDLDIDVTTGSRFHTLEILFSMAIKMGIVVLIGAPAWSVLTRYYILNTSFCYLLIILAYPCSMQGLPCFHMPETATFSRLPIWLHHI
jgi:sterol desaturase/sphingolipid hydroxylase (fatty acid hydroxylase superfamily)